MATIINGNNAANTIAVTDKMPTPGYTVTVNGGPPTDFTDTSLTINTLDAGGGTDVVNLGGLTAASGVTTVTVNGGGGVQNVTGSALDDLIDGKSGNDILNGGLGNDTIIGGNDADQMYGGAGNDRFEIKGFEAAGDKIYGGTGTDTVALTGATTLTSFGAFGRNYSLINAALPTASLATYSDVETFDGGGFTISGVNNGSDVIDLSGFKTVTNLGTINTADATGGVDYVNVATADAGVIINGGGGTQIVVGSTHNDTIDGKSGDDIIYGDPGAIAVGFDAVAGVRVDSVEVVSSTNVIVEGEVKLTGSNGVTFRNNGTVLFGQGGVSTVGFGVQGGNQGVASSRGIDGGESMTIEPASGGKLSQATLTIGLNNGTQNQTVEWAVDVYDGATLLTTITGSYNNDGSVNDLIDIAVTAPGGATFDRMVLKNTAAPGGPNDPSTEPFALTKVVLDGVVTAAGDDTITGGTGADKLYGDNPNAVVAVTTVGFDAISPSQILVTDVVGSGSTYTVEGEVKLTGSAGLNFRNNGTVLTGQGGVSTAGFGVQGGPSGVASSRGIDGGESMTIESADAGKSITEATLTIGLNNGTQNQTVEWAVDVYDGATLLKTITGSYVNDGSVNDLIDINVDLGGEAFTKMVLKNGAAIGEPFALSKVSLDTVDAGAVGNDTFLVKNGEVNPGDLFDGGLGTDTILNTGGAIGITSFGVDDKDYPSIFTGFTGAPTAAGAIYKNVEVFDGNNGTITGSNNGFDIIDFSGFRVAKNLGTINTANATGGADYVNVSTADAGVTVNGGAGTQIIVGSAYADTLTGFSGADTLTGGGGKDNFVFNGPSEGIDTITDFMVADDFLNVKSSGFGNLATGTLDASRFVIGTAATTADHRFVYDDTTGTLFYDSNGSASGGVTQFAQLSTGLALTNSNFVVF
jgi:Ca2+-binding RTX toxin-like protein